VRTSGGTVRHHLGTLVRSGLVAEDRTQGRCRYYPKEAAEANLLYRDHWRYRDVRFRVLLAARVLGDARPSNVARATGISRQLAAYHLGKLVAGGELPAPERLRQR